MKSSIGITTSSGNSLPRGAWLVVMFLFIVGALNYIDRNMLTTMRFSIVDSIPMSDAQFGLLTSVFLWVYGLMSPLAGYLADKFKRSHIIIFSLLIWSLVTWMTGHATTFNQLLFSRALMGISEAFYMPAALALITDYHRDGWLKNIPGTWHLIVLELLGLFTPLYFSCFLKTLLKMKPQLFPTPG